MVTLHLQRCQRPLYYYYTIPPYGPVDEVRTRNTRLGRTVLYQLNYYWILVLAGGIEPPATGFGELKRSCTFIFLEVLLLNY